MKKLITLSILIALTACLTLAVNAAVGTVVYGHKTDEKPNMEYIDESWGEPVIYVDKDSPNTELAKYWTVANDTCNGEHAGTGPNGRTSIEPEPSDFWMYVLYDSKYIYLAFKSPDEFPLGCDFPSSGDGMYLWLQPLETMTDPHNGSMGIGPGLSESALETLSSNFFFWWNLAYNDYDVDRGGAAVNTPEACIYFYDDMMHAMIAIPRTNLGLHGVDLHGMEFGICVVRLSSWTTMDEGQAGWLCWGESLSEYTTKCNGVNTLIFVDPEQGEIEVNIETNPPETDAPETEAPETDAPETDAPETDAPETDAPETDAPETDAPETDAPETDAPETDAPETDAPETDAPETDTPETDAPETDAPETDAPETDAPETDAPETDAPAAHAEPAKKGNTGLIIGIVAAVVVVGAVVGIVLGKKKK